MTLNRIPLPRGFRNDHEKLYLQPDYSGGIYISSMLTAFYYNYIRNTWQLMDINSGFAE